MILLPDEYLRMRTYHRRQYAFAVLIGLIVFLLGSLYHEIKTKDAIIQQQNEAIHKLTLSNQSIVDKLSDIFTHVLSGEQAALLAGQTPTVRIEDILSQIKGIDQAVVQQALDKAYRTIAKGDTGATGATGATGRTGSQGPAGQNATTTTTRPGTTTTTRLSSTTTTTQPRPTTTTTVCIINALGLKVGCR